MRCVRSPASAATACGECTGGAMPAHREDAGCVFARIVTALEHRLVAGALAFLEQLPADPPHQRMKPEQRLHQPMQRAP